MGVPVPIVPDKLGVGTDEINVPPSAVLQCSTQRQSTSPTKERGDMRGTDTNTGRMAREMNDGGKKGGGWIRWNLTTQNFRGLTTEADQEGVAYTMERQNIDIICGQETWLADTTKERWDTGELMINFGKDFGKDATGNVKTKGRTEGVCFILNKKMAKAFEEGGKRVKKYCSRLASIRIPLSNQTLYIINAYAPDSGQSKAKREGFQRRLECALADCKAGETLILAGDFNASMGVAKKN